jgi:hypothetical protein
MNTTSHPTAVAGDYAPAPRRRSLCLAYAAIVIASYVYIAQPGGPVWIPGAELPWMVGDALLIAFMLRGSARAVVISGALDAIALLALVVAEPVQTQPGFIPVATLLAARLAVLLALWRRRPSVAR